MVRAECRMSDEGARDDIGSGSICFVGRLSVKFLVGCVNPDTLECEHMFWGDQKLCMDFQLYQSISAPSACVVQGPT